MEGPSHIWRVWSRSFHWYLKKHLSGSHGCFLLSSHLLTFNFWLLLEDPAILCKVKKQKHFQELDLSLNCLSLYTHTRMYNIYEKYTHTHIKLVANLSLIEDNPPVTASFSLDVLFKALIYSMYDILLSLTVHPAGAPTIFAQEGMSWRQEGIHVRHSLAVNIGESRIWIRGYCWFH